MSALVSLFPRGPGISRVRSQAAAARALLDELERVSGYPGISEQVADELESLALRLVEVARTFRDDGERPGE